MQRDLQHAVLVSLQLRLLAGLVGCRLVRACDLQYSTQPSTSKPQPAAATEPASASNVWCWSHAVRKYMPFICCGC